MGIMKKKLIEEQIEQELELEMVDSKDGEVTFKVVEVDNEREDISYVHVRDEAKVEEAIQKMSYAGELIDLSMCCNDTQNR